MLSNLLDDVLGPHSKVSVLRVLFAQDGLNGREVARRAGLSPRAASQALTSLVQTGVLRRHAVGTAHLFSINRRRRLVSTALEGLFKEEQGLSGAMGRDIVRVVGRNNYVSVAVFGSYARGESTPKSDLDILVILRDPRRASRVRALLSEHGEAFQEAFSLRLSPYVIGAAEFAGRFKEGDRLVRSMVKEARVIAGKPLAEAVVDES